MCVCVCVCVCEWITLSIVIPHIILEVIHTLDEMYGNETSNLPLSTGIVKSDVVWVTTGGIPKGVVVCDRQTPHILWTSVGVPYCYIATTQLSSFLSSSSCSPPHPPSAHPSGTLPQLILPAPSLSSSSRRPPSGDIPGPFPVHCSGPIPIPKVTTVSPGPSPSLSSSPTPYPSLSLPYAPPLQ